LMMMSKSSATSGVSMSICISPLFGSRNRATMSARRDVASLYLDSVDGSLATRTKTPKEPAGTPVHSKAGWA
jgi:hypothetical protein